MNLIESIPSYKRYLKRRNLSAHTVRNYLHRLQRFVIWVTIPVEEVSSADIKRYIDTLLEKRLTAQTINGHLIAVRSFYGYLIEEEDIHLENPVIRKMALRIPSPLPQHLQDRDVVRFFEYVRKPRDIALFMLMLRCGLRVEEVAHLTLGDIDYSRSQIMVKCGKGNKDRVVYISNDAASALAKYLRKRPVTKEQKIFLVEKGVCRGQPISVRGIQKRIEYYSRKSGLKVSCHKLRHNADSRIMPTCHI
ncbi:MAG: tyrosine-type recombinase/integrase [Chlorobiaceae bacterium]|nr:tyrosine-type recombinase/integrase [Chlorobiaceae bacterium]